MKLEVKVMLICMEYGNYIENIIKCRDGSLTLNLASFKVDEQASTSSTTELHLYVDNILIQWYIYY